MVSSIEITSDNHFLDNLSNYNFISVCVVKENWQAYTQQSGWDRSLVAHLDVSGGELRIHGVVIRGQRLKDLAGDLYKYQCRVNRNGFSIYNAVPGQFRRVDDMFPWHRYGVTPRSNTIWNGLERSGGKSPFTADVEEMLSRSRAEVEALRKKEAELSGELRERGRALKEKEAQWNRKETELSRLIHDQEKTLKEKEAALNKKDRAIQGLKNALAALSEP